MILHRMCKYGDAAGLVDQAVEQYSSTEQWLNRHTPDNGSV